MMIETQNDTPAVTHPTKNLRRAATIRLHVSQNDVVVEILIVVVVV
jgi:hypothetical protein